MRCVAAGAASLHRQRALLSGTRHRSSSAAVAHVRTALIEAGVALSDNPYERARHGRGESFHAPQPPALVAFPNTSNEVRTIVRACVTHRVPLVPFGAGTSLEGHVGAVQPESLSVDMSRLQEISQLPQQPSHEDEDNNEEQPPDALVVVQAGVTREQLSQALRATGYQFTVDPGAATATIGGMVACNAAGTTTVRYGALRDNLLGVECILADDDATLVRTGCRTRKNSAGYDLTSLFCGSEGTLGVVTQATLRVWPVPAHVGAGRVSFGSVADAARAVAHLSCLGVDLVRCELLDTASVAAFNAYNPPSPQGVASTTDHREELALLPTLFLELQAASESILAEQIQIVAQVLQDEAVETQWAFGADERQALWKARHSLYYAAIASRPEATGAMVTDAW
jgi:D-lactate dehydrogenase (cytochrome)